MRLLLVHDRIGAWGGAETNLLATAVELRRRGHVVALAHGEEPGRDEAGWLGFFDGCFPLPQSEDGEPLSRSIALFRPTAVFVHTVSELGSLRALSNCGRPVVRMVHDHNLYCMRGYKYSYFTRRICERPASAACLFPCFASIGRAPGGAFSLRWVSYSKKREELSLNRSFTRMIVAGAYMREQLLRNGFAPERIEVHPPAPPDAAPAETASFGELNRIVYAGQIIRGKGVDVLLESLARVSVRFTASIVGDGSQRPECERLSHRLGLGDRVRFAGFVPPASVGGFYRDASLAVMSSVWPEPFGATGLEAMRRGLPVVAFDAGGIREWLIDGVNGYLVPWMDRSAYARRIEALLGDKPLARRLGENGRRLAADHFGFEAYVDGLEDLFTRVSGPHVPASA